MSGAGDFFLLHIAPVVDGALIARTNGRVSATGIGRVGLVTTIGAKSGQPHTNPLVLIDDGDGLIATGSHYGLPTHPGWSYNLLAHPACEVLFMGLRRTYCAELLEGDARDAAWKTALDFYPGFARYELQAAPREIRLFRLRPTS